MLLSWNSRPWNLRPARRHGRSGEIAAQALEVRIVPASAAKALINDAIQDMKDGTADTSNALKDAAKDLRDEIRDALREERRNGGNDAADVDALNAAQDQLKDTLKAALDALKDARKDGSGDLKDALKALRDLSPPDQAIAIQAAVDAALTEVSSVTVSVNASATAQLDAIRDILDDIDNGGQTGVQSSLVGTITLPGDAGVIGPATAEAEVRFTGDVLVDGSAVTVFLDPDLETPFDGVLRDIQLTINGVYDADTGTVAVTGGSAELIFILGIRRSLPLEAEDFENIVVAVNASGALTSLTGDVSAEPIAGLTDERGLVVFNFQAV
jgi:hypothetical protein